MSLNPKEHYSLKQLFEAKLFPTDAHNGQHYIRFIGTQATRGNFLSRDMKAPKNRGEYPFKGSDVNKFIDNIR